MISTRLTLMALSLTLAPMTLAGPACAQLDLNTPDTTAVSTSAVNEPAADTLPEAPQPQSTQQPLSAAVPTPTQQEATFPLVNGQPYGPPSQGDLLRYYIHSTFGLTGTAGSVLSALFGQAVDAPANWDQNWTGFGQRVGSAEAVTVINGTVKFVLSDTFREDDRYYRCRGCSYKDKISNILLAEVTARHGADGHRMFSVTPIVSSIAGTVVAHEAWYPPGNNGIGNSTGSVAVILVAQVGVHVFEEFVLHHAAEKLPQKYVKFLPGAKPPKPYTD